VCIVSVTFFFLCNFCFLARVCIVVYRQDEKEKNIEKNINKKFKQKELFSFSMELEELRQVTRSFVL
jgi:hypothetical protein